ncbi:MucB-RseB domain-containing protein [Sulfidibacter corallicola]|uniref:MucB/RseB N-terminal domain-containing protein n=1 Tax=Sulfidibacter corallicola TaxID=2818388 RepID=A0A8A4TMY1_SULCO|nr:sigma-E factor regulatory protein RseB domain-containing protein [Sulfidibacter corallicola]QTD50278.1 hypothetical protein J3U87_32235 [Sulfidibacter corallicola]
MNVLVWFCLCLSGPWASEPLSGPRAVLPAWTQTHDAAFAEITFKPGMAIPNRFTAGTRYGIIRLEAGSVEDWRQAAYELKHMITVLKARAPRLQIALQGPPASLDAVNRYEIAGYVDAYAGDGEPYVPEADQTASVWKRTNGVEGEVLASLLDAQAAGVAAVIFEEPVVNARLAQVLGVLQTLPAGDLDVQPSVQGVPQRNAHFFLDADKGDRFLFLQTQKGDQGQLTFGLDVPHTARLLFPEDGFYAFQQRGGRGELRIDPQIPYYLFAFEPKEKRHLERVTVAQRAKIDPYEVVADNQVFRKSALDGFESMVATEAIHVFPLAADSSNFTWIERLVVRKGKPTEHYDIDLLINGVSYPQNKQREEYIVGPGRFNAKVLDIDLDLTYDYVYLGEDQVSGRACHKIGFRPKQGSRQAKGVVWIDRQTHAHLKMDVTLLDLKPPFSTFEYTTWFAWKSDDRHRFFTVDRIEGKVVLSMMGFQETFRVKVDMSDVQFNREDVEDMVADAYRSDLRIIRETDDGPRYMVKPEHKATRKRRAKTTSVGDTNARVMIEPDAFASQKALVVGAHYDSNSGDTSPLVWFDYLNQDFLDREYILYAGPGVVAFSNPSLFGSNKIFSTYLVASPGDSDEEYERTEPIKETEVETTFGGLGFSLASPVGKHLTLKGTYEVAYHSFDKADDTLDEFVLPVDMWEHKLQVDTDVHTRYLAFNAFYSRTWRSDWQAWGLNGQETGEKEYSRMGFSMEGSWDLSQDRNLGYSATWLSGSDLDRFSRLDVGEADISGFGSIFTFDRAAVAHLDYATQIGGGLPIHFGVDAGRLWLPETGDREVDLVGASLGLLFNGPWKTDIGLEVGYGVHSSRDLGKNSYTISLTFHRRL